MVLSTNTVKTQAKSIYRKLDASSRSEAVERAREFGLLEGAPPTFNAASAETRPIARPARETGRPGFIPTG
jgi:hypothetical protein